MNIPRFSLTHKATVWILLILVLAVGLYNYLTISQREDPEFKISVALVITIWPGASAEKMERLVTQKIEEKVEEINTIEEITSTTRENLSVLFVRMVYDCDIDMAWQKLRNKLTEVRPDLPDNIIGPDVMDDFGDVTAMIYSLSSETAPPAELKKWAESLKTRIKRVQSVGKVELLGEQEEAIYIEGPMDSFTMYSFSPLVARQVLDLQNVNMPSGYVRTPMRNYRLEVTGSFHIEEQLANAVLDVSQETGAPLKVKDVFTVRRGYKEPPLDFMLTNSLPSVGLDIRMRDGHNLVSMGEKVRKVAEEFKKALPENIQLDLVHDQPRQVASFVGTFMTNLFEGLAIVILVMFLSMGARSATLIAFSLPLSILLTFAVMPLFGVDLETVSIAAFIIALGMLVDNAIIVTDNIDVHLSRGETPFEAAWRGTRELSISCVDRHTCNRAGLPATAFIERRNRRLRACVAYCRLFLASGFAGAGGNHDADRRPHLSQTPHQRKRHERESRRSSLPSVPIVDRKVFEIPKERDFSDACGFCRSNGASSHRRFFLFPGSGTRPVHHQHLATGRVLPCNIPRTSLGKCWTDYGRKKHVTNTAAYIGKGGPRFYMTIKPQFNSTNYAQVVVSMDDSQATRPFVEKLNEEFRRNIAGARIVVENPDHGRPGRGSHRPAHHRTGVFDAPKHRHPIETILRSTKGSYQVRDNGGEEVPNLEVRVDPKRH